MDNYFFTGGIIAIVFALFKFAEMRLVLKENKPVKDLVRDTVLVYLSSVVALFVGDQLTPAVVGKGQASAFLGKPEF